MGLIEILTAFGFDPKCQAKMLRHQDNRRGVDFDTLVNSPQFEEYQSWQSKPVFHDLDYIVSFLGDGGGRAKFWGVYKVNGHKQIPYEQLPKRVPWPWRENEPHFQYELERVPGYEPLEDELVIAWSGEQVWAQHLKDADVLACPTLHDIDVPSWSPLFSEGKAFVHLVTSRKRSREAREKCLEVHECRCSVCGMSFPEQYGGLGDGFMHVHHLTEVASQSGEYEVDPEKDLRPVCPNCHAMLHWNTGTPRTIEGLRKLLGK